MNPSLPNDYIISHIKRETKESILCNAVNKVAVIGDTGVGKTSFIQSYVNGFPLMAIGTTLGVNFHSMFLDIKREKTKLNIWDTAGQDRFRSIIKLYLKNIHGIILMYDIYTSNIRQYLDMWLEMINAENKNIYIVVLCNKIDGLKERNTDHGLKNAIQKGEAYCNEKHLPFFTCSVQNNENTNDAMNYLLYLIRENPNQIDLISTSVPKQSIDFQKRQNSSMCC